MDATNNIATDLFHKIRSRFSGLKLGRDDGTITIIPEEARFFDFDYTDGAKKIGHISISLAEENSIKVYFSTGITEGMTFEQKEGWYSFLKEMREFAKRRLMAFDTRDISKDNLDKRDYEFLARNNKKMNITNEPVVGESFVKENSMYGTRKVSYQKLLDTRLIIKHSKTLVDDTVPGSRARNISALFVENQEGERFKYPFIHLAGARAMQRHVANGGVPYDDLGRSIIKMSEEIAQLRSFSNYVVRNDLMNSETNDIVSHSQQRLNQLRETVRKLAKQRAYEEYKSNFAGLQEVEVPEEVIEDYTNKFTVRDFKEDIKGVFPIIYKLMKEQTQEINYNDISKMDIKADEKKEMKKEKFVRADEEFDKFADWVLALGESSLVLSNDIEDRQQAVVQLNSLVSEELPVGVDGLNAIDSLKGLIEDPALYREIVEAAKLAPDSDARPMIKAWLEDHSPEVLSELDFGDTVDADSSVEKLEKESTDLSSQKNSSINEIAEFVFSFYDKETGSFPKGPESISTMVGKKFGERAEMAARKMVERLAPHQAEATVQGNEKEMNEISRIKQLSGVSTQEGVDSQHNTGYLEDKLSSIFVKLVDKGHSKDHIEKMKGRIAEKLGYEENDPTFSSVFDKTLNGPEDNEVDSSVDDYVDSEVDRLSRLAGLK